MPHCRYFVVVLVLAFACGVDASSCPFTDEAGDCLTAAQNADSNICAPGDVLPDSSCRCPSGSCSMPACACPEKDCGHGYFDPAGGGKCKCDQGWSLSYVTGTCATHQSSLAPSDSSAPTLTLIGAADDAVVSTEDSSWNLAYQIGIGINIALWILMVGGSF